MCYYIILKYKINFDYKHIEKPSDQVLDYRPFWKKRLKVIDINVFIDYI